MLAGAGMVLVGAAAIFSGVCAKIFGITEGLLPKDPLLDRAFSTAGSRWRPDFRRSGVCLLAGGVL